MTWRREERMKFSVSLDRLAHTSRTARWSCSARARWPTTPWFIVSFFYSYGAHRDLHSFPTRRSSDLAGAVVTLGLAVGYVASFDRGAEGLQWVTDETWIAELGIHYKLGLDGLNLFMVLVTALLFAAALLHSNLREWERPRLFYAMFALAESAVLGAFLAQDLALFVAFFDLMLIPFYFLIDRKS